MCFSITAKNIPERVGARTQPCFTPLRMLKAADAEPSKSNGAFHVFVEGSDDAEKFGWTSDRGKDLEEAIPTDQNESLVRSMKARRVAAFAPYISPEVV